MKTENILLVILATAILIAFLPIASAEEQQFNIKQGSLEVQVNPVEGNEDAASFYNYDDTTWSGDTPYMESKASKMYLYRDTTTGNLSLIIHHGVDSGDPRGKKTEISVKFNLTVPQEAYIAVSDDPAINDNPAELRLGVEPEGNWTFDSNKVDGGVISGLATDKDWCITIEPNFGAGIDKWHYVSQTDYGYSVINLNMSQPVIICDPSTSNTEPSPTPTTPNESNEAEPVPALTPVGLIALAGVLLVVALVVIGKK